MKRHGIWLFLLAPFGIGLLVAAETADLATIWKIKDEGLNRSQVMETLSYLTDVHGPRLTGSPNIKKAMEWAQGKLQEWGLVNVHTESYPFGKGWALERFTAEMLEPTYSPLIAFPKSWTPGTEGMVTAEAIAVDIQKEADFENYRGKLRGKFVLTQPEREVLAVTTAPSRRLDEQELKQIAQVPEPGARRGPPPGRPPFDRQFQQKLFEFYLNEGVVALLEPSRGDGGTIFVGSGRQRIPGTANAPPVPCQLVVAVEHYNRILRILRKQIPVQLRVDVQTRSYDEDLNAYNLIGEIPGTDRKDEVVMLGAHFDSHHSGSGATDNAAGSAVVMEAVRILKVIEAKPRRTIRIGLWTGEEQGLLGSRAYVSEHFAARAQERQGEGPGQPPGRPEGAPGPGEARRPPAPLHLKPEYFRFSAYFNLDNGTGKIRGIYLQGNEETRPIFGAWMEPFQDMAMTTLSIRDTSGTDHLAFDAVGLPGFQFIQDPVEYNTRTHHSNMDVYDRIQRGDMMQASVIVAAFVWQAANREGRFPRKPLPRDQVVIEPKP